MLPGFRITLAFTLVYLAAVVLIPLASLPVRVASMGWEPFWQTISDPRVVASYRLTFLTAFWAALANGVFGTIIAWVLVRYEFPGRRFVDAVVDLPFALPTAVAGIALAGLFAANGWIGALLEPLGIKVAFRPLGVFVALTFIGLPFVVRTVQPVLEALPGELEEAAATLGASRFATAQALGGLQIRAPRPETSHLLLEASSQAGASGGRNWASFRKYSMACRTSSDLTFNCPSSVTSLAPKAWKIAPAVSTESVVWPSPMPTMRPAAAADAIQCCRPT